MEFRPENVDIRLAATDSLPPGEQPVMLRCPMRENHKDSEKSLAVFPANVHCFGCRFHIKRRYESLGFLLGYWDGRGVCPSAVVSRVRGEASRYTHEALEAYRERVKETSTSQPINMAVVNGLNFNLVFNREKFAYLKNERGLSDSVIQHAKLGYDGARYSIPVINEGYQVLNIRYRRDDTRPVFDWRGEEISKYDGTMGRNGLFLYPLNILADYIRHVGGDFYTLYIVEGELDALRLWTEGIPAVSPTNGAGQVKRVPSLLKALPWMNTVRKLVILTDMDEPGELAALETALEAERLGYYWERGMWELGKAKDITEYLRGNRMEDVQYGTDIEELERRYRAASVKVQRG